MKIISHFCNRCMSLQGSTSSHFASLRFIQFVVPAKAGIQ